MTTAAQSRALSRLQKRWRDLAWQMESTERTLIANALRLAADQYAADAAHNRMSPGGARVAQQFDEQASECREIAGVIEL